MGFSFTLVLYDYNNHNIRNRNVLLERPGLTQSLLTKEGHQKTQVSIPGSYCRFLPSSCQQLKSLPKRLASDLGINPACGGQVGNPCLQPIKSGQ